MPPGICLCAQCKCRQYVYWNAFVPSCRKQYYHECGYQCRNYWNINLGISQTFNKYGIFTEEILQVVASIAFYTAQSWCFIDNLWECKFGVAFHFGNSQTSIPCIQVVGTKQQQKCPCTCISWNIAGQVVSFFLVPIRRGNSKLFNFWNQLSFRPPRKVRVTQCKYYTVGHGNWVASPLYPRRRTWQHFGHFVMLFTAGLYLFCLKTASHNDCKVRRV